VISETELARLSHTGAPEIITRIPGPMSMKVLEAVPKYESLTRPGGASPPVFDEGMGATVKDPDGNLFIGMELVENKETGEPISAETMGKIMSELLNRGVIALPCGRYHNVMRFMPSLVITREYLEKAADIVLDVCKQQH
jgi:4-aminobutyrate aminotransferase-like enzyme